MAKKRHSGTKLREKQAKRNKINWNKIKWGTLTNWLKRHREEIIKLTGQDPFVVDKKIGKIVEINDRTLRKLNDPKTLQKITPQWKKILKKIRFKLNVLKG